MGEGTKVFYFGLLCAQTAQKNVNQFSDIINNALYRCLSIAVFNTAGAAAAALSYLT